jgi:hypothetical protein
MDNYTDKYLKYKNKYLELKQQLNQTGGLADPKYDAEYAKLVAANPGIDGDLLSAQHELQYNADYSYKSPGVDYDAPKQTTTPKTTTKTVNNTYLYSPYLDPLVAYALPSYKYYTKSYLDPYYTTNVYSPYTYYKNSYRDPYADDYEYEEEKPKRRSKRTSKKKSKKTSKKTSKRKTSKKSKRKSKRRSRK